MHKTLVCFEFKAIFMELGSSILLERSIDKLWLFTTGYLANIFSKISEVSCHSGFHVNIRILEYLTFDM